MCGSSRLCVFLTCSRSAGHRTYCSPWTRMTCVPAVTNEYFPFLVVFELMEILYHSFWKYQHHKYYSSALSYLV